MGRGRKPGKRAVYQVGSNVANRLRSEALISGESMGDMASKAVLELASGAFLNGSVGDGSNKAICIRLSPEAGAAIDSLRDLSGAGPSAILGVALLLALDRSVIPGSD